MNKVFSILVLGALVSALAAERPPVPSPGEAKEGKKAVLKSCNVPEWLIILPPPVEKDYEKCLNRYHQPSDTLALTRLKLHLDKSAELISVNEAPGFTRAYIVTYKLKGKQKSLLCNDKVTYCVPDEPVLTKH